MYLRVFFIVTRKSYIITEERLGPLNPIPLKADDFAKNGFQVSFITIATYALG